MMKEKLFKATTLNFEYAKKNFKEVPAIQKKLFSNKIKCSKLYKINFSVTFYSIGKTKCLK